MKTLFLILLMASPSLAVEEADKAAPSKAEPEKAPAVAADGLKVEITVKEYGCFFRYCFKGHDLTGKGCSGTLTASYATKDRPLGIGKKDAAFNAALDGDGSASFDWLAGLARSYRQGGVTGVQWTLTTDDGRHFSGLAPVPRKPDGKLPPEEDIKELRLTDGTVLKEVSVIKVRTTGLSLVHKNGATNVPKEKLPADLLVKYAAAFKEAEEALPTKEEAEKAAAERDKPFELVPVDPPDRSPLQVQSAMFCRRGGGIKLSPAEIKELNDLLEKCPRGQLPRSQLYRLSETVHFAAPEHWFEYKSTGRTFCIYLTGDGFRWRIVPQELKPRIKEFFDKLDQRWSDAHPPAPPKKKKGKKPD